MSRIFGALFIFADLELKWKMPWHSNIYSGLLSDLQTWKKALKYFLESNKLIYWNCNCFAKTAAARFKMGALTWLWIKLKFIRFFASLTTLINIFISRKEERALHWKMCTDYSAPFVNLFCLNSKQLMYSFTTAALHRKWPATDFIYHWRAHSMHLKFN